MFLDYFSVLYQKLFLKNKKSYFNSKLKELFTPWDNLSHHLTFSVCIDILTSIDGRSPT
jgi:hypothetical protein